MSAKQIEVQIMGQSYILGCPEGGEARVELVAADAATASGRVTNQGLIAMLRDCDAGTGLMHESFHPDRPEEFSRPWFAWANTLFAELLIETYGLNRRDR